jgi:cytochrome c peroxidase
MDNWESQSKIQVPEIGRLPMASGNGGHVRSVFRRMGFDEKETVALIGAHCVGRCHKDRSGYEGRKLFSDVL